MVYLTTLPGLVIALALALEDIRSRTIPRTWVAAGLLVQTAALCFSSAMTGRWEVLILALALGAASAGLQACLALVRPGALGMGDVTCTGLTGLSLGALGWVTALVWWLLMGLIGALALGVAALLARREKGPVSIPFAPVIVGAAILAGLAAVVMG